MWKIMDLKNYSLEDLLLSIIKSEVESEDLYYNMAKKTKNWLLKDKLEFLSKEEDKHRIVAESIYKKHIGQKKIVLPEKTPVPIPEISIKEDTEVSKLLKYAMQAEKYANEFYKSLAELLKEDVITYNIFLYFADMEMEHYKILELEKENAERFEESDVYWPMVHVGP